MKGKNETVRVVSPKNVLILRVATVREKYLENEVFSRSGNFVDGQRNLERPLNVREKSGNLKINGCGKQTSEKIIYSVQEGKRCTFS